MRYALVGGLRREPQPKLRAVCPSCNSEVVAKCGNHVIWHWAHLSRTHCDQWWEPETEWHRAWKNRFPAEWQEIVHRSPLSGEMHIADVRTAAGLVLEFQRSSIHPDEVRAREDYSQQIIWVVDGSKNQLDPGRFNVSRSGVNKENGMVGFKWSRRNALFDRWCTKKPVFIDFGPDYGFWRILRFDPVTREGVAGVVNRDAFVQLAASGTTDFSSSGGPAS